MQTGFGAVRGAVLLLVVIAACGTPSESRQPTAQPTPLETEVAAAQPGAPTAAQQPEPFLVEPVASYVTNVVQSAETNTDYRRVLFTGPRTQLVLMTIQPNQDIGEETHRNVEQIIVITSGTARASLAGVDSTIGQGEILVVPPGTPHDVINTGPEPLHLYTIYSPPNHIDGRVQATREDAQRDTGDQEFAARVERTRACP